jgi:hypothetical protein
LFVRAPKVDSLLNPIGALSNSFLGGERIDSFLIVWSDFLKSTKRLGARKVVSPDFVKWFSIVILRVYAKELKRIIFNHGVTFLESTSI